MAVIIRPAVDSDRTGICTVHVRAIRETCSLSYSPQQIDVWAGLLSPDTYTALLKKRIILVGADATDIVGFGQLDPENSELQAVYVRPERQRQGIGRRLLSELEGQARALGISRLEVSATLNAVTFYEQNGYAPRRAAVHRMLSGLELQCLRMEKRIRKLERRLQRQRS